MRRGRFLGASLALVSGLLLMAAVPAGAQITGLSAIKNAGNSPDTFQDDLTVGSQRTTTVGVLSNTGIVARVRYAEVVGVDVGAFSSASNTQASDYNINFNVTAPGAYDLTVTTSLNGAFTIVDDGDGPGTADATAVTGTQTGGILLGTLSLSDPGGPVSSGNTGFLRTSGATIQGTSNGSPVAHALRFQWSASCSSSNGFLTGGDECAVRLGLTTGYSGETASDYPGAGGRVIGNDGHFVTISYTSLCGDGVVQGSRGEQCDLGGGLNGTTGFCCSSSCQLLPNGASCRPAAGVCDLAEVCNGSSPTCPADSKSTALCRASAGVCDVAENCNGISNTCPTDGFLSSVCRPAAGGCDVAESCPGNSPNCPADVIRPNGFVCRAVAGICDVAETCNGVSAACPADGFESSATLCRAAADICDVAENCTGSGAACPPNGFEPNTTPCRPSAGACDVTDNCTGSDAACPPDSVSGAFVVCRPAADVCDIPDNCDGVGVNCPADAVASNSTLCRAAAGVCDVAENCDGSNTACPADGKSVASCRAAVNVCDVAESCDGVGNDCPADGFAPNTTVCRPSADPCDVPENCTGSGTTCPADTGLPDTDSDTVCDQIDNCDAIPNTSQDNNDADPLGDACDPCTNIVPTVQSKAKLQLSNLLFPVGDEKLKLQGFFANMPTVPTINPVANGLRVVVIDSLGNSPIDITVPPGAYDPINKVGWKVNGSGTAWTYKNRGSLVPLVSGITKAQLKSVVSTPGKYKFQVKGKNGTYPVNPANLPLVGTIVIDVPFAATGQCGEASFPLTFPAKPSCIQTSGGKNVKCK